jgi:pre-mRNA-splicing factor 38A
MASPQNLIEKIIRMKIYNHPYWKESCFGLTGETLKSCLLCCLCDDCLVVPSAETLVDRAVELDHIGGTYGGAVQPCAFMCLVLKMLQIQPTKDIVVEFIKNEDYKCVPRFVVVFMCSVW